MYAQWVKYARITLFNKILIAYKNFPVQCTHSFKHNAEHCRTMRAFIYTHCRAMRTQCSHFKQCGHITKIVCNSNGCAHCRAMRAMNANARIVCLQCVKKFRTLCYIDIRHITYPLSSRTLDTFGLKKDRVSLIDIWSPVTKFFLVKLHLGLFRWSLALAA